MNRYSVRATSGSRRAFLIIDGRDGLPIYDGAPYGNDKPILWRDEDVAIEVCDRLNNSDDHESE